MFLLLEFFFCKVMKIILFFVFIYVFLIRIIWKGWNIYVLLNFVIYVCSKVLYFSLFILLSKFLLFFLEMFYDFKIYCYFN